MRLGIDFGTTRIVVAAVDRGNYPVAAFECPDGASREWIPPLIAVRGQTRLYGWDAWAAQGTEGVLLIRSIKRVLADAGPETEETEVVPFEVGGIRSGNITYGHRFMAPAPITVRRFDDYVTKLEKAKVVLADLTGKNPNVFYELGLAHASAKPAILVTESLDFVPFDLRALRIIVYDKNNPGWGDKLRGDIEAALGEVLASRTRSILPAYHEVGPVSFLGSLVPSSLGLKYLSTNVVGMQPI